ncbi:MAG: right-handed parallel beta-helix repeat-containing protein [bacterium]
MKLHLRLVFFLSIILCAQFLFPLHKTYAATTVTSDIVSDTTWTASSGPFIVSGVIHVSAASTLTIEPGVVVKFDKNSSLKIDGEVDAIGDPGNKIYFTSFKDDTIGGDDNGDGANSSPVNNEFVEFAITSSGSAEFNNCEFTYGTRAIDSSGNTKVSNSNFTANNFGIFAKSGSLNAENNTFSNNKVPMQISLDLDFTHSGNTYFGNQTFNGIGIDRTFDGLSANLAYGNGDGKYFLSIQNISLDPFQNVTVEPGVVLSGVGNFPNGFDMNTASFSAQGTPSLPIHINKISFNEIGESSIVFDSVITNNSNIIASDGAQVTVKNSQLQANDYATIDMEPNSDLDVENSSIKNLESDGMGIWLENGSTAVVKGVTIDGCFDGIVFNTNAVLNSDSTIIKNSADSGVYIGAPGNSITFNNSQIISNVIGIYVAQVFVDQEINHAFTQVEIPNNNTYIFSKNTISSNQTGVQVDSNGVDPIALQRVWWGDKTGPYNAISNTNGIGNSVSDTVNFIPWLRHDPAIPQRTPVLIVPGVLGSELSQRQADGSLEKLWLDLPHNLTSIGDGFMDPLQFNSNLTPIDSSLALGDILRKIIIVGFTYDYSNSLINEFQNQGYTENTDLFVFPYDWRYGVRDITIDNLKQKISDILAQTDSDNVDVVAHSTGGLLVKKYVMQYPTDNHIDKAVFVGVPNTGAPKAIKTLLEGDNFGNLFLANSEMKKIARNLPVVYDLAPTAEYYKNKGSFVKIVYEHIFSSTSTDLNFDDMTNFLTVDHDFNALAWHNAQDLHTADFDNYDMRTAGVDVYAIDGCKTGTITKISENHNDNPLLSLFTKTYSIQTESTGDGTVPLESSTNLPINDSNKFYALKASHGEMLSQDGIRQQIVNIVSGATSTISNSLITQDINKCNLNGRAISIFSPLSIDVVDQNGNHTGISSDGVSTENNIPNADYEIFGDHKFVYLPTDDGQTYTIKIAGTGTGVFTVTDATIVDNQTTSEQVFSKIPVTTKLIGDIIVSTATTTINLDTNGDGTTDKVLQPTTVLGATDAINFDAETFGEADTSTTTIASTITTTTTTTTSDTTGMITSTNRSSGGYGFVYVQAVTPTQKEPIDTNQQSVLNISTLKSESAVSIVSTSVPIQSKIVYNQAVVKNNKTVDYKQITTSIDDTLTANANGSNARVNQIILLSSLSGIILLGLIGKFLIIKK